MGRRIGCALVALLLILGTAGTAVVWLILSTVGVVGSAPFARLVSGAALLLGLLAVAIATRLVRRLAAPAERLVDAARRVEAGDYSARVPVRGPSELRSLASAFNEMSARLEADELRRRSVLADVAHELRTPLTIIRGHAEGIADGVYAASAEQMTPILAATRTLEGLVDDLRTLALAEAGILRPEREPVDVAGLVEETLDGFRAGAGAAGVQLSADLDPQLPIIQGDPARLSGVIGNLIANALRHTLPGGTVRVIAVRWDAGVRVTVSDDGEGIDPDLVPRIFDRFVKGPRSTGSGLGLAIVRDVVDAHGGSVSAESTPGKGTRIHVTLPAGSQRG